MKYSSLEIDRFRGIRHIKIENLGDINIFTGKNNVGKSTCLEAIALLASGDSKFKDIFGINLLEYVIFRRTGKRKALDYLFNSESNQAKIFANRISNKAEGGLNALQITEKFDKNEEPSAQLMNSLYRNEDRRGLLGSSIVDLAFPGKQESPIVRSIYAYFRGTADFLARLVLRENEKTTIFESTVQPTKTESTRVVFIRSSENEVELHDLAAVSRQLHEVIKRLREKIPEFEDLRRVGDDIFIYYKKSPPLPLSSMGDGFKACIMISLYAQSLDNGVLILEEPENYLHTGLMIYIIDELIKACKEHNIQIFLSSHSSEFIKLLLERSKMMKVSLIRMSKLGDDVEAEVLIDKTALEHLDELGVDLRGL